MRKPKLLRIMNKSLVVAVVVVILSFILPIVPCTKAPVIANPEYKLGICTLPNPFQEQIVGISQKFYNYTTSPLGGLVMQFAVIFIIFTAIFLLFRRKTAQILDLSNK